VLKRVAPMVPASLAAVFVGVVAVKALHLDDHGVDIVGHIDSGLPSIQMPDVSTSDFGDLVGQCLGVMLVDVGALAALYRAYTQALGRVYGVAARPDFIAAVAAMAGCWSSTRCPGSSSPSRATSARYATCSAAPTRAALVEVHPSIQDAVDAVLIPGG
jgi:sulfate permease, SulP family